MPEEKTLAFVDIETTGLLPGVHEITEIGIVIARESAAGKGAVPKKEREIALKVRPVRIEDADPRALSVSHYDGEVWEREAVSLREAMDVFARETKKATMVAHNVSFDWSFLSLAFSETGVKNEMDYHRLDTLSFAYALARTGRIHPAGFSLAKLCAYFGIENKKAHTALSDAKATYELYGRLFTAGGGDPRHRF